MRHWQEGSNIQDTITLAAPVSLSRVLKFALLFLAIDIVGALAQRHLGRFGFLIVALIGGAVSSASTTAGAAPLTTHGQLTRQTGVLRWCSPRCRAHCLTPESSIFSDVVTSRITLIDPCTSAVQKSSVHFHRKRALLTSFQNLQRVSYPCHLTNGTRSWVSDCVSFDPHDRFKLRRDSISESGPISC